MARTPARHAGDRRFDSGSAHFGELAKLGSHGPCTAGSGVQIPYSPLPAQVIADMTSLSEGMVCAGSIAAKVHVVGTPAWYAGGPSSILGGGSADYQHFTYEDH